MILDKLIEKLPIIACQEATRLSSEAMERKLSIKERIALWLHLRGCDLCTRFLKQTHGLRNLLRNYAPPEVKKLPQDAKDKIIQAIKNIKN